jgi:hypothetical protein
MPALVALVAGIQVFMIGPMPRQQPDLFEPEEPEALDAEYQPKLYYPDPERVRARLHWILAEMRAARTLPWDDRDVRYYRTVFPQMANCLPEEEKTQLCFEFETEMERLKAA